MQTRAIEKATCVKCVTARATESALVQSVVRSEEIVQVP